MSEDIRSRVYTTLSGLAVEYAWPWLRLAQVRQVIAERVAAVIAGVVPASEAYDGELDMHRGLIRVLRVAARQGDLAAVQQALLHHAVDDANARDNARQAGTSQPDTLPAWLQQRFDPRGPDWSALTDDDRSYWEHAARAVRRAVARGGFKADTTGAGGR
jgi:hypothetical protein